METLQTCQEYVQDADCRKAIDNLSDIITDSRRLKPLDKKAFSGSVKLLQDIQPKIGWTITKAQDAITGRLDRK